ANLNLSDAELALYERLVSELEGRVPVPDLVVYLQASVDVLLSRIARRGREYERQMPRSYIESLADAYNHFLFHYPETRLLVLNTNEVDFVRNRAHFEDLLRALLAPFEGVQYYTPSWER